MNEPAHEGEPVVYTLPRDSVPRRRPFGRKRRSAADTPGSAGKVPDSREAEGALDKVEFGSVEYRSLRINERLIVRRGTRGRQSWISLNLCLEIGSLGFPLRRYRRFAIAQLRLCLPWWLLACVIYAIQSG